MLKIKKNHDPGVPGGGGKAVPLLSVDPSTVAAKIFRL